MRYPFARPIYDALSVGLLCLSASSAMAASNTPTDTAFEADARAALVAFSRCDATFFQLLAAKPTALGSAVALSTVGAVSTPTVADPLSESGRIQNFEGKVRAGGLNLLAWRNEVSYDATMGAFLWWGFDVEGSTERVAQAINQLVPQESRLLKLSPALWARAEKRRIGDPINAWRSGADQGTVAEKGTVERILMVEAHEQPNRTKLYCSLQGSVTAPLLQQVRPDLPASYHP